MKIFVSEDELIAHADKLLIRSRIGGKFDCESIQDVAALQELAMRPLLHVLHDHYHIPYEDIAESLEVLGDTWKIAIGEYHRLCVEGKIPSELQYQEQPE